LWLEGTVALVAAGSKGLGKASALALAGEGVKVAICARTPERLEMTAEEIRQTTGAEVLAVPADVAAAAGITAVVTATAERFGRIDILVNNSGGPAIGRFSALTDDDRGERFCVGTPDTVPFLREVAPFMRQKRWGRIIGIQSTSVKQPVEGIDLSNGIRPGIAGLAKAIMPDLAKDGITINLVLPGSFLTSRISPGLEDKTPAERAEIERQFASTAATIPVGRLGSPIELGQLVAFLASERAAYITGAVYQIDGGNIKSNL